MNLGFSVGLSSKLFLGFTRLANSGVPTVVITSTESDPTSADPIPFTFTWSEGVYAFGSDSLTIVNGSATLVEVLAQNLYIIHISPDGAGDVSVTVDANSCYDVDGDYCAESDTFTIEYAP